MQRPLYVKSWVSSALFSIMLLGIVVLSKYALRPSKESTAFGGLVITCMLCFPSMILMAVDMFNCVEGGIEPEDQYLRADLRIACDDEHKSRELSVGVWLLILVVIFVPILVHLLRKDSNHLESQVTLMKFGYLYKGYREEMYLW